MDITKLSIQGRSQTWAIRGLKLLKLAAGQPKLIQAQ
jgi:hypothetical protein